MKFHFAKERLGMQPVAHALDKRLIARSAATANFQPQLRDVIGLLQGDEGIDERIEPLVLAHASEVSEHRRIGRHWSGLEALVVDAVVNHAHPLGRHLEFITDALGVIPARSNETAHVRNSLGHEFPNLFAQAFGHAVDVRRLVLQQADNRRSNGFLEALYQAEQ